MLLTGLILLRHAPIWEVCLSRVPLTAPVKLLCDSRWDRAATEFYALCFPKR